MSSDIPSAIGNVALRTAVGAVWAQWAALTPAAVPAKRQIAKSIIDPEALVLTSLAVRHEEPRLFDLVAAWAESETALLSVQRAVSLAAGYPDDVRVALSEFAALASGAGDPRWKRHAVGSGGKARAARPKDLGPIRILDGPALLLRLRAGFGVGAKADLLGFLLGLHDGGAILRTIALATGYTDRAVRKAVDDMHRAGLVTRIEGPPPTFYVKYRAWLHVLTASRVQEKPDPMSVMPPWQYWAAIFAFLIQVIHFAGQAQAADWSPYIASSRARDLVQAFDVPFKRARLPMPDGGAARGADYLGEFDALVRNIEKWVGENV